MESKRKLSINRLTVEKTIKKLEETFETEKGKIFVLHLIRAFIPMNLELVKDKVNNGAKDCLTEVYLKNNDKLDVQKIPLPDLTIKVDEGVVIGAKYQEKLDKLAALIPTEISNPRTVIYSEESDKLLTVEGLLALNKYVMQEIIKDNKEINFIINRKLYGEKPKKKKSPKQRGYSKSTTMNDLVDFNDLKKKLGLK